MGTEPDLDSADRGTLLAVIAELRATIAEQQAIISKLQRRLIDLEGRASSRPRGMPGNRAAPSRKQPEKAQPRNKRERGYCRKKAHPTRQEIHALDHCLDCGTAMAGGTVHRRREVIDIPQMPFEVVEHVFVARRCAKCGKRRTPSREALRGKAVGRGRFGLNLASLVAMFREEFRMPVRAIQRYLLLMHGLRMSEGAIFGLTKTVAHRARPALAEMLKGVRESLLVHMDETGWREGGVNGYSWVAATPTEVYFVRRGRNKEVVDELLGEQFCGVVTCNFYAAYNHHRGLKQRCWVHLLRDVDELAALYPQDKPLAAWKRSVYKLWVEAKEVAAEARPPPSGFAALTTPAQLAFEQRLMALCQPYLNDETAPHSKLCRRIERFIEELFVFVSHPGVPSDNNAAERSLRHLVVGRKISGGTRSKQGSDVRMALASLYGTWRLRGQNPFDQCRKLLGYHQV